MEFSFFRREDTIKVDLKEPECEAVKFICLVQQRHQWRALVIRQRNYGFHKLQEPGGWGGGGAEELFTSQEGLSSVN
jgi:hypothetical protein